MSFSAANEFFEYSNGVRLYRKTNTSLAIVQQQNHLQLSSLKKLYMNIIIFNTPAIQIKFHSTIGDGYRKMIRFGGQGKPIWKLWGGGGSRSHLSYAYKKYFHENGQLQQEHRQEDSTFDFDFRWNMVLLIAELHPCLWCHL